MKLNPRHIQRTQAERDITRAMLKAYDTHELTIAEMLDILNKLQTQQIWHLLENDFPEAS